MKKALIAILILLTACCLLLTGCSCKHANTRRIDTVEATCTEAGYTGDLYCEDCKKVIEKGTVTAAAGHVPQQAQTVPATCTAEGLIPAVRCAVCDIELEPAQTLEKSPHSPDMNRKGAAASTCSAAGYTGDIVCSVCGQVLQPGQEIPPLPHTPAAERAGAYEPSCAYPGYTGDIICSVCRQVIGKGEEIPRTPHTPEKERIGYAEATCRKAGYTGTLYCSVCYGVIEEGRIIEKLPHTWEETNKREATCSHAGYTGDRDCTVCGDWERGEEIPRLSHDFDDNNTCRVCGYRVAGVYVDGKLELSWQELMDAGLIEVENGSLNKIAKTLYGTLVIDDDIDAIENGCARESSLDGVWFSGTIDYIGTRAFSHCSQLKDIRFFGIVKDLKEDCFAYCESLEYFPFPDGIEEYYYIPYKYCEAIKRVDFSPSMLEKTTEVKVSLESLREVNAWPKHMTSLNMYGTSFEVLTGLPETLEKINLKRNGKLRVADLAGTGLTELSFVEDPSGASSGSNCYGGSRLEYLTLPDTLTALCIHGKAPLRYLILPDGVSYLDITNGDSLMTLAFNGASSVETAIEYMVWPTSLKADGVVWDLSKMTGLGTVCYRGSESLWKMSGLAELMPSDVQMVYDCTDEMVDQLKAEAFAALSFEDRLTLITD